MSELVAVSSAGLPVEVERPVRHALVIATIGAVSWLAASVAFLVEDSVLHRVKVDVRDNRRARRRTRCAVSAPDLPGAQCLTLLHLNLTFHSMFHIEQSERWAWTTSWSRTSSGDRGSG